MLTNFHATNFSTIITGEIEAAIAPDGSHEVIIHDASRRSFLYGQFILPPDATGQDVPCGFRVTKILAPVTKAQLQEYYRLATSDQVYNI